MENWVSGWEHLQPFQLIPSPLSSPHAPSLTIPPSVHPSHPPTLPPSLPPSHSPSLSPTPFLLSLSPTHPPSHSPSLTLTLPPSHPPSLSPSRPPTLPPTHPPTHPPTTCPPYRSSTTLIRTPSSTKPARPVGSSCQSSATSQCWSCPAQQREWRWLSLMSSSISAPSTAQLKCSSRTTGQLGVPQQIIDLLLKCCAHGTICFGIDSHQNTLLPMEYIHTPYQYSPFSLAL